MDKSYARGADAPEEFNLREWGLKAKKLSRENTNSRRFSASNIKSFREDAKSFRSTITPISSTVSSPGYPFIKEEINPSTYSFTAAIKALQARSLGYGWECLSPDGFMLNSKWNEAEKYISNPLSGEVPVECLSAKTLSGRSFRKLNGRVTVSAPLASANYSSKIQTEQYHGSITFHEDEEDDDEVNFPSIQDTKMNSRLTRSVGTQSTTPVMCSSRSTSPAETPSIQERSLKERGVDDGNLTHLHAKLPASDKQVAEVNSTGEEEDTKILDMENEAAEKKCKPRYFRGGCLSLWVREGHKRKHKLRNKEPH